MILYLCGLGERVLRALGDGAKVSAVNHSEAGQGRNDQQHETCQAGGDVELEEEREETDRQTDRG